MAGFPKLGDYLVKFGFVTREQVETALQVQNQGGGRLGEILLAQGIIREEQLTQALAKLSGLPAINLDKVELDASCAKQLDANFCMTHCFVPIGMKEIDGKSQLVLAFADPLNLEILQDLQYILNVPLYRVTATTSAVKRALFKQYPKLLDEMPTSTNLNVDQIQPSVAEFQVKSHNSSVALVALLDLLEKNKILTSEEAQSVRKLCKS